MPSDEAADSGSESQSVVWSFVQKGSFCTLESFSTWQANDALGGIIDYKDVARKAT